MYLITRFASLSLSVTHYGTAELANLGHLPYRDLCWAITLNALQGYIFELQFFDLSTKTSRHASSQRARVVGQPRQFLKLRLNFLLKCQERSSGDSTRSSANAEEPFEHSVS